MSHVPNCPDCGGRWLNGWRWQHDATACALRAAEDATQAADADRLRTLGGTFARPATAGEARLWLAVTGAALRSSKATTTVSDVAPGVWVRQINKHYSAADAA